MSHFHLLMREFATAAKAAGQNAAVRQAWRLVRMAIRAWRASRVA
jgi:hypothetical protein